MHNLTSFLLKQQGSFNSVATIKLVELQLMDSILKGVLISMLRYVQNMSLPWVGHY